MQLVRYDAAKKAISEYKTVDEVKDFRDKALAVEAYAKQAKDFELERDAAIARVRAERRCGELLLDMEKAKASAGNQYTGPLDRSRESTGPKTLSEMGLTKDQSAKWQQLAKVPNAEFEEAINLPGAKPSANNIIKKEKPDQPRMDPTVLWWWGRLVDIESKIERPLNEILGEMTDAMLADAERVIPKLKRWING